MRQVRLIPLYVALVLALAALGAINQVRFAHQEGLIEHKSDLYREIAELRSEAALVHGPLAVGAWARAEGMVPSPEVQQVRHAAFLPAPEAQPTLNGLEMRTRWR